MSSQNLTPEDLAPVYENLIDASNKWHDIGLLLGVPDGRLRAIELDKEKCDDRLRETLSWWLRNADSPTWDDLRRALRSPAVGYGWLAENLNCPQPSSSVLQTSGVPLERETSPGKI